MTLSPRDLKRFWSYVTIPTGPDGLPDLAQVWLWTGATTADGHGRFWLNGRHELAHRVSFFIANGWLPDVVCHVDPVPGNVNPHHLYAGSATENVADRQRQGRQARGERNGRARLTEASVRAARNAIVHGMNISETARSLGVHKTTLRAAVLGETWRQLDERAVAPSAPRAAPGKQPPASGTEGNERGPNGESPGPDGQGRGAGGVDSHPTPPNASSKL